MIKMDFAWLTAVMNAPVSHGENSFVSNINTDTRTIKNNEVFLALKGPNFDGHKFVQQAYEKGAIAAIVDKHIECEIPQFIVPDTRLALGQIGAAVMKKVAPKTIAITGSVGKTGTKEMLKLALSSVANAFANKGNFNNCIGVPLSLSRVPENTNYCILELGMNKVGEIKSLSKLVSPEIGIITAIENSHLEGLKTLKNIADAKSELLNNIKKEGCFIYNSDTNFSKDIREKAENENIKTIISYGKNKKANIQLLNKTKVDDKYLIEARCFKKIVSWKMPILADHWYINSLCVLGIGKYYGINLNKLLSSLEKFKLPKGRGNFLEVVNGLKKFHIIDESYNSNPASLFAALQQFKKMKFNGRKIAILGDMKELGKNSKDFHLNMKNITENTNIDLVFTIGQNMKNLNQVLSSNIEKYHFEEVTKLEAEVKKKIKNGDGVLVKGSHSLQLYSLVKNIAGEKYDI